MRTRSCVAPIFGCQWSTPVIKICVAVLADPEGLASFYGKEWNEKKTQVMVYSLLTDLRMAADRTDSRLSLENCGFWLNASYKKEHCSTLEILFLILPKISQG